LAGLKKLVKAGFVESGEIVVLILTGHLLKDPDYTMKFHRSELFAAGTHEARTLAGKQRAPIVLDPSADAVIATLTRAEQT